jgi:hypothetical protein
MQAPQRTRAPARPVTPAAPAAPVDAARQDRFLRQLVPPAWDEVDEPDDREASDATWFDAPVDPVDDGRGDGSSPQGDEGRHDDEQPSESPAPPPVECAPLDHASWAWLRTAGLASHDDAHEDAGPHASRVGATSSPQDAAWLGDIVEQVAQLTAGGDARFQHWSVTVPLDPQSLPDCELRITLSPGSMVLRFRTGSAESARLVSRHRDTLRARLEALPSSPSAIDIDLE